MIKVPGVLKSFQSDFIKNEGKRLSIEAGSYPKYGLETAQTAFDIKFNRLLNEKTPFYYSGVTTVELMLPAARALHVGFASIDIYEIVYF